MGKLSKQANILYSAAINKWIWAHHSPGTYTKPEIWVWGHKIGKKTNLECGVECRDINRQPWDVSARRSQHVKKLSDDVVWHSNTYIRRRCHGTISWGVDWRQLGQKTDNCIHIGRVLASFWPASEQPPQQTFTLTQVHLLLYKFIYCSVFLLSSQQIISSFSSTPLLTDSSYYQFEFYIYPLILFKFNSSQTVFFYLWHLKWVVTKMDKNNSDNCVTAADCARQNTLAMLFTMSR